MLITYLAQILDCVAFIVIFVRYGEPGNEDSEMILFFIWLTYQIILL